MEFKQISLNDGTLALSASGPIVAGDAERLRAALTPIPKDRFGARVVRLNSPGGSVFHAMQMADVFDELRVMAVVAWDDVCASACASVLFIAADARLLLGNGQLVFHSCDPGTSTAQNADALCNADIARFAGEQGFSPDWLFTGMQQAPGDRTDIVLTRQSVGCMGLQAPPGLPHYGARMTPCLQLALQGAVTWDRDWDRPAGSPPLREPLAREVNRYTYLFNWSPPDVWSYGVELDGIALTFRRFGKFAAGPELSLFCHYTVPGILTLRVRQLAPAPIPRPHSARIRTGDVIETFPVHFNKRQGHAVLSDIRLDSSVHKTLETDRSARFEVTLLDAEGNPGARISAPWATGHDRHGLAWDQCAGRYPGAP